MVYYHIDSKHRVGQILADKAVEFEYKLLIGRTECLVLGDSGKE